MKTTQIALIVLLDPAGPMLVDTLTDGDEIEFYDLSLQEETNPLAKIYRHRHWVEQQDEELADYLEQVLCKPFPEILFQRQATRWFRMKMRIEQFQRKEKEAAQVIADYAYRVFLDEPDRSEFYIESDHHRVRVRVFTIAKSLVA
jgi:arginine deiminase